MINNFHLIPNKSELIFQKRIKENSCNEHSILIYEVEVLPKITTSNSNPIELDPYLLYVCRNDSNTSKNEFNYCNFLDRKIDLTVGEFQFNQLLNYFNNKKLPSSIELLLDQKIPLTDPDDDVIERVDISFFAIKFSRSIEV